MASAPPSPASPLPSAKVTANSAVDVDAEPARHALVVRPPRAPGAEPGVFDGEHQEQDRDQQRNDDQEQAIDREVEGRGR